MRHHTYSGALSPVIMISQANNSASDKNFSSQTTTVLLGPLLIKIISSNGVTYVFRGLADSGNQSSFITEQAAQLLCVPHTKSYHNIVGLSLTTAEKPALPSNRTLDSPPILLSNRPLDSPPRFPFKQIS